MFDAGGRLNASANGLVIIAGTLLILALTLNSLRPRAWLILAALVGLTVMILSGGKAGILSGIVSTMLFFLVQRKIGSTVLFASALIVVSTLVFAFTPLSSYFIQYGESDQGSTLSGRTELWTAAWPDIRQKPILGHGYVASRFISVEVEGAFPDAGNLHNGFLEALYNNGIIGLILLLGLHLGILRNLFRLRKAPPGSHIYKLAVGCFILYINILLNGCFNATFGGHAYSPFILFLALAVIAERLTALAPAMHTFRAQDELVRA
jgi:O-antigen ligase